MGALPLGAAPLARRSRRRSRAAGASRARRARARCTRRAVRARWPPSLVGGLSATRVILRENLRPISRRRDRFFCNRRVRRKGDVVRTGGTRPRGAPGARAGRRAAAGGPAAGRRPGDRPGRGAHRRRAAEPRRRVLPAALGGLRRRRRRRCGPPSSTSSPSRGKMQNPVTGSGGMLIGVVDAVGPDSPLGLAAGTAGRHPGLAHPHPAADHRRAGPAGTAAVEQVPAEGTAILFARSIAAVLPDDLPDAVSLAVLDVCGAPAATARVVERAGARSVTVLGAAGKSGCLSLAAARAAGADRLTGLVRDDAEAAALTAAGPGRPRRRRRRHRPAGRRRRGRGAGRPHRRLRRRARRRARRGPRDGRGRHRGLLLHGDVVLGGGPGRGGDGGGRDDAGRQRLHAGARRPGPGAVPLARPACAP